MKNILELYSSQKQIKPYFLSLVENKKILVTGMAENHNCLLAASTFIRQEKTIIYIASNIYKATYVYEALCELVGNSNVVFYAIDEVVATEALAVSNEFKYERINTLISLVNKQKKIVVTHITAVTRRLHTKETFQNNNIILKSQDIIDITQFIKKLIEIGYKKAPSTTQVGTFSVRGGVIDIFPINSSTPIRLDLFDNEIEYLKTFNPETQRSIEVIKEASIFPINELIYEFNEKIIDNIKKDAKNYSLLEKDFIDLQNYNNNEKMYKYINYITDETENILDYDQDVIVFFDEFGAIKETYNKTIEELTYYLESKPEYHKLKLHFFEPLENVNRYDRQNIYLSHFKQSMNEIRLDDIISVDSLSSIDYRNEIKYFIEDIKILKKTYLIVCTKKASFDLLSDTLLTNQMTYNCINDLDDIKEKQINLIILPNAIGFGFIEGLEVIHENQIFKKAKFSSVKYRSAQLTTKAIQTKEDLQIGDYIVHFDYGIGQYLGIKTVELKDVINDYIMLLFHDMELYIPVEKINLIEKYLGSEGSVPKLTKISSKEWEKKKAKIQAKMEDIAEDLIEIQAKREQHLGYKYLEDDEIQKTFENDFEYEATSDQLKTIKEIKADMEEGYIIDRLVCGDVGYGKTEVAIRISMKTVLNNKQVAYLAPTTILSRQHYYTFKNRFENYGIKVALLNRLIDPKEQVKILKELSEGKIDIIIGTHSLLSDNIIYRDLGMLIVDEEQRFGVVHKEKIKQYKDTINVLTLTATPIPRTLQMAVMGVRQLSLIETPPQNRYPVQTYVLESNDAIIREAIYRELGRQGQVFYLHNRVFDLDRVYHKLHRLVPEARIMMAHGQMPKEQLEDAIQSFIDKEYDVLLCTTIIETGIDIPNTNTLIVDMADRLGLSQMYQIRGRVGRSERVSYAYFTYEKDMVLNEKSAKRLEAIKEFTVMGSGYKIAVRDLAIRGAGDILGKEQSGFIDTVGLDLYMKMLSSAIEKVQGKESKQLAEINYNIEISKHVNNKYVSDDDIKIYIHKQIYQINSAKKRDETIEELKDRFGEITEGIKLYIDKQYMEGLLKKHGVEKVIEDNYQITLTFSLEASRTINGQELFQAAYKVTSDFTFEYKSHHIIMHLRKRGNDKKWIYLMIKAFELLE